jgi:hypothetical protein
VIGICGCVAVGAVAGLVIFGAVAYVALTQFDCSSLIDIS